MCLSMCLGGFGFIGINSQKIQTSSKTFLPGRIYFRAPYTPDLIFLNPKAPFQDPLILIL